MTGNQTGSSYDSNLRNVTVFVVPCCRTLCLRGQLVVVMFCSWVQFSESELRFRTNTEPGAIATRVPVPRYASLGLHVPGRYALPVLYSSTHVARFFLTRLACGGDVLFLSAVQRNRAAVPHKYGTGSGSDRVQLRYASS